MPARRFTVTGIVQGVCFRMETERKAEELQLTGWVRNATDGSVQVHAEGQEDHILQLEAWLHEGPPAARVENVQSENVAEEGLTNFSILETK